MTEFEDSVLYCVTYIAKAWLPSPQSLSCWPHVDPSVGSSLHPSLHSVLGNKLDQDPALKLMHSLVGPWDGH